MTDTKVGRNAHQHLRDEAAKIANAYACIVESTDDPVCVNPDDHEEDRTWVSKAAALGHLVGVLRGFAETGNFDTQLHMRNFTIRTEYNQMLEHGWKRAQAIPHLMEKYHLCKTTMEDIVKRKKPQA
jgi:hypothetical protein